MMIFVPFFTLAAAFLWLFLVLRSMVRLPGKSYRGPFKPREGGDAAAEKRIREGLQGHVQRLAGEIGIRHCLNPTAYAALEKSAGYLRSVWQSQGYEVHEQPYDAHGRTVRNLWVEKKDSDGSGKLWVIGAHYDSVPECPAANDNASGVAALLELSGLLASLEVAGTVHFVAFVNEESPFGLTPLMGSRVYSRKLAQEGLKVDGMISLETLGCYSDQENSQKYPPPFHLFYPTKANFIAFVGNYASKKWVHLFGRLFRASCDFPSEGFAPPTFIADINRSDHWSFWQEGYPAFMVTDTAPFRYPYYHTPWDTPEKIDYPRFARVVVGIGRVLRLLTHGK